MPIYYTALRRFDPADGERWDSYIRWSGLTQLREVITLDNMLCEDPELDLNFEDWNHNVHEDYMCYFFRDAEYLSNRMRGIDRVMILGACQNPLSGEVESFYHPQFEFRGFDLVEVEGGSVSALLNCGGFNECFSPDELSQCGLLSNRDRAIEVQQSLRRELPNEHHANCDVWALWRMTDG